MGVADDRVEMRCRSIVGEEAGGRAGTMLHESSHMNYWDGPFGIHQDPPWNDCPTPCVDTWHSHGLVPGGSPIAVSVHQSTQIEAEFLCDLDQFYRRDLPRAGSSGLDPNFWVSGMRFINPPGWTCGVPRPLE